MPAPHSQRCLRVIGRFSAVVLLILFGTQTGRPDEGSPDGRRHNSAQVTNDRTVAIIRSGGPGCFGIIVSRTKAIVPLAACNPSSFTIDAHVSVDLPYSSTPLFDLPAVVIATKSQLAYAIISFRKPINQDSYFKLDLFIGDKNEQFPNPTSIRVLPTNSKLAQPSGPSLPLLLGSPCTSRGNSHSVVFDCDDPHPPIIVTEEAIIAVRSSSNLDRYVPLKLIVDDTSILNDKEINLIIYDPDNPNDGRPLQSFETDKVPTVDISKDDTTAHGDDLTSIYDQSRALIIGASNYSGAWGKLSYVAADSDNLKRALERQHFDVEVYPDPLSGKLYDKIKEFLVTTDSERSRLLVYFMGHGWTDPNHHGYIVPIDAPDPNSDLHAFQNDALSMIEIESLAKQSNALHVLFVFDSCFSGTIFETRTLSIGAKTILADAVRPVRQFLTAGNEDQKVPADSVFTPAFIRGIEGDADKGSAFIGADKLGLWLKEQIAPGGIQTPSVHPILDPRLNAGDFLFFPQVRQ